MLRATIIAILNVVEAIDFAPSYELKIESRHVQYQKDLAVVIEMA